MARLARMRKRGIYVMPAPPVDHVSPVVPDGHKIKGVSSLQKVKNGDVLLGDGTTVMQWVKTAEDQEQLKALAEDLISAMQSKLPRVKAAPAPAKFDTDLANLYVITDYHVGMMAWHEETGENWDTNIAEDLLFRWFKYAIKSAPKSEVGVLAQLGDFLHYDSLERVTPTNRNLLDSDTRPQLMVRVGLRVLRKIVDLMLRKHDSVHLILAEGNHDLMSSAWLREAFDMMYSNEPRLTVDTSPDPYHAYCWGDVLLMFHHGHLRDLFGRTKFSYAHMGHMHHQRVIESNLMIVEQHPTLAPNDAHAARHGYYSERVASVITYHKKHGRVGRLDISPEMV